VDTLRTRIAAASRSEGGLSLIEVVVAMMIFMIIFTGLLYTMVSLFGVTRDSRERQVATNLAAAEIDLARDAADVFKFGSQTRTEIVNDENFTIVRESYWSYNSATSNACGAGSSTLRFKKVKVTVTWDGLRKGGFPVTSETLINPNERISNPELGTIMVSVKTTPGEGAADIPVTAVSDTGVTLKSQVTDADGCAYFLLVAPGTYTVTLASPTGTVWMDTAGKSAPFKLAPITAGTSSSPFFTFDQAAQYTTTYSSTSVMTPNNMPTSFTSTRPTSVQPQTVQTNPRTTYVYPSDDGYSVMAGDITTCAAQDPSLWTAASGKVQGVRPAAVAASSGTTSPVTVDMGTVKVGGLSTGNNGNKYIVAVSSNVTTSGQPGCATQQILRFNAATATTATIALPYGTWTLYKGQNTTYTPGVGSTNSVIGKSDLTLVNTLLNSLSGSGVVTFDPRAAG